ncbi:MAG: hypothetical protein AAFO07_29375 [Bacteroidota bacterium]
MSAEIIILLVGGVFLLIAILDFLRGSNSSSDLININLRIPLGIIGVLLLIYGGYSYGNINLQGQIEQVVVGNRLQLNSPVDNIKVLSPVEGDSVKCRILTLGVYPESNENDVWVVLRPSDDRYYPQSDHTNTSYKRNGEWQVITRFGGDQGESYDVIVYETDSQASEYFSSTIQDWKAANAYPGIELKDLPSGANEVERIVVSLRENCRGVH